ncbi:hypothetical protein B0H17DRAFT_931803, partial [Mycena rosella]
NGVTLWSFAEAPWRQGTDALMNNSILDWTGDPAAAGYMVVWRASEVPFWTEVCVPVGAQCGVRA